MSKVSLKNDSLPTFEPLDQAKVTTTQKRKRTLKNNTTSENEVSNKRVKAKKNNTETVEPIKSVVWIGATLMQQEEETNKEITAAFSIFYGLNDKRNVSEKVVLKQDQNLNHVYIMGAIRALEGCQDENLTLSIYTGSNDIQTAINQQNNGDALYDEIKERIAKRKGSTVILFKDTSLTKENEEHRIAYKMAKERLIEDEAMVLDDNTTSTNVVETLEVAVGKNTTKVSVTAVKESSSKDDEEMIETTEEIIITENTTILTETKEEPVASPSWASTLNLRNLLDILKAPFVRNKKN